MARITYAVCDRDSRGTERPPSADAVRRCRSMAYGLAPLAWGLLHV